MYINKNKFKFRFWRRFLGSSLALFGISLIQGFLEAPQLLIAIAMFLGGLSGGAIYVGTKNSGFQKFFLSIGFVALISVFASLLFWLFCYSSSLPFCAPRPLRSTIVVNLVFPLLSMLFYFSFLLFGNVFKKRYRA